ncbi:MAG: ribonuclease Z [Flavobacteriaceae bacterium]
MIFNKEGNTTVVLQEDASLHTFLKNLNEAYDRLKNDHIVINLFSFSKLSADDILEFLNISNTHRAQGKSFVLVTSKVSYDEVPDEICVVPTIQEAKDIIEMEEIERDLDLY